MKNSTITPDNYYQENFRLAKKILWNNRKLEKKCESVLNKTLEKLGITKLEKPNLMNIPK